MVSYFIYLTSKEVIEKMKNGNNSNMLLIVLGILVVGILGFNAFQQSFLGKEISSQTNNIELLEAKTETIISLSKEVSSETSKEQPAEENPEQALFQELIPRGIPEVYGSELRVNFETPVQSLEVLRMLDGDLYPNGKLKYSQLTSSQKERYVNIGMSISCEFCCGAESIVFPDGRPACGCAHSAAMRGLAMHLLVNHGNKYTNAQVLDELTKWKTLFFPKQMLQKAVQLQKSDGTVNATTLNELPDMVGGC